MVLNRGQRVPGEGFDVFEQGHFRCITEGQRNPVGPGARNEKGDLVALDVQVGDLVLFGKWSGTEVKIDGEDLLIMKESDVMGVLEKTKTAKKAA